jgi:hypothetical protein
MKPETEIKKLNKEIKELEAVIRDKSFEICNKNIEIAELERKLCIALNFIEIAGKR